MSEVVNLDVMGAKLVAKELNVEFEQLGKDVYHLAMWIETMGNHGYERKRFEENSEPAYFLTDACSATWKGILFYGEGSRKRDFRGWGVRKSPHWSQVWGDRYGWDTECGRAIIEQMEAEAWTEKPKQDVKRERPRPSFVQGEFDQYTSMEIGHRWVMACIMARRYRKLRYEVDSDDAMSARGEIQGYECRVWQEQEITMQLELSWRAKHHKKETERVIARKILDQGIDLFYTKQTVDKWISMQPEPQFVAGDFEQPYDDRAQHAPFMSEAQVRRTFLELLAGERADGISSEDLTLVLSILRKQLANLKGGFE